MAKQRMINTKIWSDSFFQSLGIDEKFLFIYLLTNEHTNIAGFYEITKETITFETGLKKDRLSKAMDRLSKSNKVYFLNNWVRIKNFIRHQKVNPKIEKGIETIIAEIPKNIKDILYPIDSLSIDYESLSHLNLNSNTNSNTNSKDTMFGKPNPNSLKTFKKDAKEILGFLNEKVGRSYREVDANLAIIEARLKEGATVQNCKSVIAKKKREWFADEKMCQYLRPKTLFNKTNFAQYVGELYNQEVKS